MEIYKHPEVIKDIRSLFYQSSRGVYNPYFNGFVEREKNRYCSGLRFYEENGEYFINNKEVKNEINIYEVLENLCFKEDEISRIFIEKFKYFLVNNLSENKEFSLPFLFAFYPELKDRKYNLFRYCLDKNDKIEEDKKFLEGLKDETLKERIDLFKKYLYYFS